MSKEQLGAASGQEDATRTGERLGWFGRLRAQPGFRTAAVAFFVTIALAVGGPAAYALWSRSVASNLSGTVAKLPAVTDAVCSQRGTTNVGWSVPVGMPSDAVYIVEITKTNKTGSFVFALPRTSPRPGQPPVTWESFEPAYLMVENERLNRWMDGSVLNLTTADVAVSVGALASPTHVPVKLDNPAGQILSRSLASPATQIRSHGTEILGIPWYTCP